MAGKVGTVHTAGNYELGERGGALKVWCLLSLLVDSASGLGTVAD